MRQRFAATLACMLLAGCAAQPPQPPRIERLSGAELEARLPQPASPINLADIVAMSQAGTAPDEIVRRLGEVHARYRLSATQIIDLARQGVVPRVLDHIVEAERRAIFDDLAADIARREQACLERIALEVRQCRLQSMSPFWPHPFADCWPPHPGMPYWRCF